MQEINFVKTTMANFKRHNPTSTNVYFITDKNALFLGGEKISSAFVDVDDDNPPPAEGMEGVLYLDKRNGSFKILVWDSIDTTYVELPLANTSYIKSIRRGEDDIIGVRGTGEEVSAELNYPVSNEDIDTLFPSDEEND